jgi:lysozyme
VIEVPQAAIDLAKRFEGFERKVKRGTEITAIPYICPQASGRLATAISATPKHPPITEAEAEVYLARDLQSALTATLRYCPVLATEPEKRLAAIVDFTFNLGAGRLQTSTLRRRRWINQRDWKSSCGHFRELRRWIV